MGKETEGFTSKIKLRKSKKSQKKAVKSLQSPQEQELLSQSLEDNENKFRSIYKDCSDVVIRSFYIGGKDNAILIYIEGLSNTQEVDDSVLSPLMESSGEGNDQVKSLINKKIPVTSVKEVKTVAECISEISSGNPVIVADNQKTGLAVGLAQYEKRSIDEPQAETVVRGPREGFVEALSVNNSMLRRRIRSPKLKLKSMKAGKYTETKIVIAYLEGVADPTLIEEITNRVSKIDVDGIMDSGVLEEFIEDDPYSPFPQFLETERPDVVTANLLEGRAAILVDGSPFSIIAPITIYSLLQASEDYYSRFLIGTAIRWLRYVFLLVSLLLPSLYVAILTFHQEMIPTTLMITVAAAREQIPFPALVEVLMMEIAFEALREAGIRLPKQVGSAVSIVGALIIGEAAVSAGIVSAPMVIVVAITGVASFTIPRYSASITFRMLRFPMIFLAGTLGLLGVMLGIILIIVHLASLRSFGVPYLSPMAPMKFNEIKDVLVRAPWWKMNTRPHFTGEYNKSRQADNQRPQPSNGGDE
ncbi:hypothetical protein CIL03_05360 [Virgibacillus indicus]|uniref:Spore germination protein n=1 Tax=Virgibacillus indicus TaxID=2024554 RepID=A0A265NEV4_9BACI|nr:spore germination protein [Virgibacillus indicus]OZU90572.1 hypothetical protein CIL03_05360 [Virgibacillus indicus]